MVVFDNEKFASSFCNLMHGKFCLDDAIGKRYFILYFAKSLAAPPVAVIPQGLELHEHFVTEQEEQDLIREILASEGEWETLALRTVKHWGYKFDYKTKLISPNCIPPIAPFFQPFIQKIVNQKILDFAPDQITVNMYEPGDGIPSHVETHSVFEDGVVSLSLQSSIMFEMRHPDSTVTEVFLPPRSLLVLKGESRYLWMHGIASRKTDLLNGLLVERGRRISVTFRKVRIGQPCECSYFAQCDSMLFSSPESVDPLRENSRIEQNYVKEVYDSIAMDFSETRHSPWPRIHKFLKDLPSGSFVCDVGCGNGKYFNSNPEVIMIGNDQSVPLLSIAKMKDRDVVACNALTLPFKDDSFDCVISIAVIHHFSTEQHRLNALKEIVRILRPGGRMLIYVWAMEQEKKKFGQQDVMVPWSIDERKAAKMIAKAEGESGRKLKDLMDAAPRKENHVVFQRYYHVFRHGELSNLMKQISGLELLPEEYDVDNWTVQAIAHKK